MCTVRIYDLHEGKVLAVDLRHILSALGPRIIDCCWEVSEETSFNEPLFATGDGAAHLEQLSTSGGRIDGTALYDLAESVTQVIWGEFRGYQNATASKPWVIILAVDSTFYEVTSDDSHVHDAVRGAFRDVRAVGAS